MIDFSGVFGVFMGSAFLLIAVIGLTYKKKEQA